MQSKLYKMPGTKLSPELLLHRTLEQLSEIKSVTVITQFNDGSVDCDWSPMTTSILAFQAMVFNAEAAKTIMNTREE